MVFAAVTKLLTAYIERVVGEGTVPNSSILEPQWICAFYEHVIMQLKYINNSRNKPMFTD